ncbi:MAG TPA: hypothetical protein VFZ08_11365, partial [Terriglobia bacterium]|nr:hypothetical protein [Terriglobia bacterium]
IRLNLEQAPENLLEGLENALAAHPGENPVVFELTQPGNFKACLRARRPSGVKADEKLLTQLRTVCGQEAVALEVQNRRNGQP